MRFKYPIPRTNIEFEVYGGLGRSRVVFLDQNQVFSSDPKVNLQFSGKVPQSDSKLTLIPNPFCLRKVYE